MLKLDPSANGKAANAAPTHETTGLFFPQFIPIPGPLTGQMQLMLVPGSGIPMRDYFAAKCLHALMFDYEREQENFPAVARDAYQMADAMIEARKPVQKNANGFPYTDGEL